MKRNIVINGQRTSICVSDDLVGWHLDYGFGDNCEVLMVDLKSK